jgi:FMN reductase (NADPH)
LNAIINEILAHRSIRKFRPDPISDQTLKSILDCAQAASTSNTMQAYSVIAIRDPELKESVAKLSGNQKWIIECPLFLIWCADMHRIQYSLKNENPEIEVSGSVEHLISATVDTSLAAQNAAIAAESLGLGLVYIGGIRNHLDQLSELLQLPNLVYPVFGMCLGVPDQEPILRPRLPQELIVHENKYSSENYQESIDEYNTINRSYMKIRSNGVSEESWTEKLSEKLSRPRRKDLRKHLFQQGYHLE